VPVADLVLEDDPIPHVRRLTLNRPEKRNAMSNALRAQLFEKMRAADLDDDISVIVIRGAGSCWSAGYDLNQDPSEPLPSHAAQRTGTWARHLVDGWMEMWDYATPIIGQVHGFCLAGGSELATACDLVYVAEDAVIGYPPTRLISPPDTTWQPWLLGFRHGMEAVLTGDGMSGVEAAQWGFANAAFPIDELETRVLEKAERLTKIPFELLTVNKRVVHRAMEIMGIRTSFRSTTELQALGASEQVSRDYIATLRDNLTKALDARDGKFGDYRTAIKRDED
jgi:enoyl-CoA hydratase